jgi:steroid delta-isomerase-like uncharacterized protein
MTSALESNKKLVNRFLDECWNEGNVARVHELVAAHCRFHDPVFAHMIAGVESMQHHIERCRRAFPDLKVAITDTIAERDEVVVHWTANGTQRGEFLGMPPTNVNALIAGTSIYRMEDGKIAEQWVNWNLMSLIEQLGLRAAAGVPAGMRSHVGWE